MTADQHERILCDLETGEATQMDFKMLLILLNRTKSLEKLVFEAVKSFVTVLTNFL
jgi:hypothetical protein